MNYIDQIAERIYKETCETLPALEPGQKLISDQDIGLYRIYAVLCLAKGTDTCSADVHDAWSAWRAASVPDHKSLIPFDQLSRSVQAQDHEYVNAIHAVAKTITKGRS